MSVGLLVITHEHLAENLVAAAREMLGSERLRMEALSVAHQDDMDTVQARARSCCRILDQGDGVLVLTDVYGSTPSNIACQLCKKLDSRVIAGVNLPMMIRVLNYPQLGLDELAEKALSGGRDGIMVCNAGAFVPTRQGV
ncbi:MAG TPA: PTS fructose transporter subunit IIA [Gammaproteobacteria bacterium]|mgnify:CR=1 FL=1|nr:PTS fructose transporter subunit IIA [Gammaproteobacteria bacterium]